MMENMRVGSRKRDDDDVEEDYWTKGKLPLSKSNLTYESTNQVRHIYLSWYWLSATVFRYVC